VRLMRTGRPTRQPRLHLGPGAASKWMEVGRSPHCGHLPRSFRLNVIVTGAVKNSSTMVVSLTLPGFNRACCITNNTYRHVLARQRGDVMQRLGRAIQIQGPSNATSRTTT